MQGLIKQPQLLMYPIFIHFQVMLTVNGHNFVNNEDFYASENGNVGNHEGLCYFYKL